MLFRKDVNILILFLLFCTFSLSAVPLPYYAKTKFSVRHGLPTSNVTALTQDVNGVIWIGTDEGLASFNGAGFSSFDRSSAFLPSNHITSLYAASDGAVWIGTERGIVKEKQGTFVAYKNPNCAVYSITASDEGVLFVGTACGLFRVNGPMFVREPDVSFAVLSVARHPTGTLFFISEQGVLFRRDTDKVHRCAFSKDVSFTHLFVCGSTVCGSDSSGRLYAFIENNRIWSLVERGGTKAMKTLFSSYSGTLYALSPKRVLHVLRQGAWQAISQPLDYPFPTVQFVDREDNVWIGTHEGLFLFITGSFSFISFDSSSFTPPSLRLVSVSPSGSIVASDGRELFAGGINSKLRPVVRKPFSSVFSLFSDNNDSVLIATDKGVFIRSRQGKFSRFSAETGITLVYKDSRDVVWAAKHDTVLLFSGSGFKRLTPSRHARISALLEDRSGTMWIGTDKGLYKKERDRFVGYTTRDGMISDTVRFLSEDSLGNLWVFSENSGISLVTGSTVISLTSLNGLPGDTIYASVEAENGTRWFCSSRGIFSISKEHWQAYVRGKTKKVHAEKYGIGDGVPSLSCARSGSNAFAYDGKGTIVFATQHGLFAITPQSGKRRYLPQVVVARIMADTIPLPLSHKDIRVPEGTSLSFELSAVSIRHPDLLRFAWKLELPGNTWNEMDTSRRLTLDHLEPGSYSIRFKSFFADESTNSVPEETVHFIVMPKKRGVWWLWILFGISFFAPLVVWISKKRRKDVADHALSERDDVVNNDTPRYPPHLPSRLKHALEDEQLYTDPDLTLKTLAKKCGTNTATLSAFINGELDTTFYNLVNGYRLERVKTLLSDPKMSHKTVLFLAYQAGFKSKTTFNTMFKRETGMTPTAWRREHLSR